MFQILLKIQWKNLWQWTLAILPVQWKLYKNSSNYLFDTWGGTGIQHSFTCLWPTLNFCRQVQRRGVYQHTLSLTRLKKIEETWNYSVCETVKSEASVLIYLILCKRSSWTGWVNTKPTWEKKAPKLSCNCSCQSTSEFLHSGENSHFRKIIWRLQSRTVASSAALLHSVIHIAVCSSLFS